MKKYLIIAFLFISSVLSFGQGRFSMPNTAHLVAVAANYIADGEFITGTPWDLSQGNGAFTITGGKLVFDNSDAGLVRQAEGDMIQAMAIETDYTVTVVQSSGTGSYWTIANYANNVVFWAPAVRGVDTHIFDFTTGDNLQGGGIGIYTLDNTAFEIESITIVER